MGRRSDAILRNRSRRWFEGSESKQCAVDEDVASRPRASSAPSPPQTTPTRNGTGELRQPSIVVGSDGTNEPSQAHRGAAAHTNTQR
jgi:hypothetical protein